MRYYFDTEFIENGRTIDLISIGIVSEEEKKFYAECDNISWYKASQWVLDNVKPHLTGENILSKKELRNAVFEFCNHDPEFWADHCSYDWVALCQLFGTMMDLPDGWPTWCMDLKQLEISLGNPKLPEQKSTEHHALADAEWCFECWKILTKNEK